MHALLSNAGQLRAKVEENDKLKETLRSLKDSGGEKIEEQVEFDVLDRVKAQQLNGNVSHEREQKKGPFGW